MRTTAILVAALLGGCVTYGTMDNPDGFVNAAVSWKGGHIKEMISAWGPPTNEIFLPSTYSNGWAEWSYEEKPKPNPYAAPKMATKCSGSGSASGSNGDVYVDVDCDTHDENALSRTMYDLGAGMFGDPDQYLTKCHVIAEFDESGTIVDVMASSQGCTPSNPAELNSLIRSSE